MTERNESADQAQEAIQRLQRVIDTMRRILAESGTLDEAKAILYMRGLR